MAPCSGSMEVTALRIFYGLVDPPNSTPQEPLLVGRTLIGGSVGGRLVVLRRQLSFLGGSLVSKGMFHYASIFFEQLR